MVTDTHAQVWAKTQGHCWYCGKLLNPWDDFTIDHMDPRKQGGGDEIPNLVPACKSCNSRKHARTVQEYKQYLQQRGLVEFWFEHNEPLREAYAMQVVVMDDDKPAPYESRLYEYIAASLRVGSDISPDCTLTLLYLLLNALQNYEEEAERIMGDWFFHLDELVHETNQNIENVVSHILSMNNKGLIDISWQQGPRNGHTYIFYFHTLLALERESKNRRRQQRTNKE
jgi:hypothetical protein